MIYEFLLFPSTTPYSTHNTSVINLLPSYHTYANAVTDAETNAFTLMVRTIDPYLGAHSSRAWRRRSTYHVRAGPFLTSSTPTTYRILLSPYTSHLRETVPSLFSLNRQIHAEASKVLYSAYTFSFDANVEAVVPFLSDLTPGSLSSIRHISLTKKALPYTKEFDRAEWSAACAFLSKLSLSSLSLSILGGKPVGGWDDVSPISASEFGVLERVNREWGADGVDLEWVEQLMKIKGLRRLNVDAVVDTCPPIMSQGLRFWVAFSKSVEAGFGEWLRGVMVEAR